MIPDPHFERLRTTLLRGQADRVPMAEITIDEGAKEAFLGKPLTCLSTDVEFYLRARYDYITLGRRIAGFPPIWDAARLENYYEVQRQVGHGRSRGVIESRCDYREYPWMRPQDLDFRILDKAQSLLPPGMKVIRYMGPVFQMCWMLMGFDQFCYSLVEEPGLVEDIMERIFGLVTAELDDALQRDIVGAVWYGDDIAIKDRLLVSPAFLRRAFFPKLRALAARCKERGVPFLYHTDGDVSLVLTDIIAAGVDALHPVDPTAMDIYNLKPKVAGRLCLVGNIDVDMLLAGTPEEVERATREHLRRLGPGGGYVMGSGNSIPRACRTENYRAMLDTTLKYGTYPINLD